MKGKIISPMWSALKTDLLDFVTTIKEDTSKTIHTVLGDQPEEVFFEESCSN